jgi:hypothetical protein
MPWRMKILEELKIPLEWWGAESKSGRPHPPPKVSRPGKPKPIPTSFVNFCDSVGVQLTPAQRVLALVACDALPVDHLSESDRGIARKLFGDLGDVPNGARKVAVVVAGARSGKSYVFGGLRALHLALTVPLDTLAPGEVATALVVAPDMRLGRQELRFALGAAERSSFASSIVDPTTTSFSIKRVDGHVVTLECLPATRGGSAVRGRSLVGAIMAECAFFYDADGYVVSDVEIYRAIAPRIVEGGQLLIASTPWAETGLLYELWRDNYGQPTTALVAHAPTILMNPSKAEEVARETLRDPINAAREFGAEFMSAGAGQFFDSHSIEVCSRLGKPSEGSSFGGGDLAFRRNSAALVIVRRSGNDLGVVELLELVPQKHIPLTPSRVVKAFVDVLIRNGCREIVLDSHQIDFASEAFQRAGIVVVEAPSGNEGKVESYMQTRTALDETRLSLPPDERLLGQLKRVVSKPQPGGGLAITSPLRADMSHGDLVSALVLATWRAASSAASFVDTMRKIRTGTGPDADRKFGLNAARIFGAFGRR